MPLIEIMRTCDKCGGCGHRHVTRHWLRTCGACGGKGVRFTAHGWLWMQVKRAYYGLRYGSPA